MNTSDFFFLRVPREHDIKSEADEKAILGIIFQPYHEYASYLSERNCMYSP